MGTVAQVHRGTEPEDALELCEQETCIEVRRELLGREFIEYIPCRAVAKVSGNTVTLGMDMETASSRGWSRRPAWLGG